MTAAFPDAREILARLVAFDTVSSKSNLPLIGYVEALLASVGVASVRTPDATGTKAALFATIGPADGSGVLLSGHTDVVPAAGQRWTSDPFTLVERDGRLYGRGACDMKGYLAGVLAAVPRFLAADLATPIHLIFSYDEEVGCIGVEGTIARFGVDLPRPKLCLVGEPTEMTVVDAHKSVYAFDTVVTGRSSHASMPQLGANAVLAAGKLLVELDHMREALAMDGDPSGRFTPAESTITVGLVQGGEASNIVPERCRISWGFRGLPGFDGAGPPARLADFARRHVLPSLRDTAPEADVVTTALVVVPELAPEPGSPAETLAFALAGQNRSFAVSYGTEAGHFQRAGVPTVVCGPGSIAQAHTTDEFLEVSQLVALERFLERLAERCASGL
ncbi:acetylornithine deacetylase [Methylopila sp. Yamaguchi]|uniref:acetylornithine deacetylase n=1 Tax=Methylopila sp. Yamaguchi TaxID=1437817 RepID=UPI000CB6243D|nr:acetylornithine deacetylase [Methylopila sp. Yamaguchi]GBD48825.1 acetylornithine deacetylase ArgE [Methylopila sp. Yamaguchi]